MFKPVQHAAQPSPLKLHTDAQQCPRGIPQAHAENFNKKKNTFRDKNAHLHPCIFLHFCGSNKVKLFSSEQQNIRWSFCTKSISVLSITLRLLHSSLRLSLFASCNSVVVPCGLVGTSGAEDLTHKDALSLQQQCKKVISFNLCHIPETLI